MPQTGNVQALVMAMRPPFLLLTPICVLLGVSVSHYVNQGAINWQYAILALIGGLFAHISVNLLNEWEDFHSGLDALTKRTPFSGGSGALPSTPEAAKLVSIAGWISLGITFLIGIYFVLLHGMAIIPLGLLGLIIIVTYTRWLNRFAILCLLASGTGFGLLMVAGSQFVIDGLFLPEIWLVGLMPFLLINNLLLLNQYPDIAADSQIGRRHFPIHYGIPVSNWVMLIFWLGCMFLLISMVLLEHLPWMALLALLSAPLGFYAWLGARKHGENIGDFPQYMAANVAISLLFPLLLSVALFIS